jgi:spermidine synthase
MPLHDPTTDPSFDGVLATATTADGSEIVLVRRRGLFTIRVDGRELMSSGARASEEMLARIGCAGLEAGARVLVGGLGLGYTLRAALDRLGSEAQVTVAELLDAVVEWHEGPLGPLAGHPTRDPRVSVRTGDIATLLAGAPSTFDAILLDVDNGPSDLTTEDNADLYEGAGLLRLLRALRPNGRLAVWSARPEPGFTERLERLGARPRSMTLAPRPGAPAHHTVITATRPAKLPPA